MKLNITNLSVKIGNNKILKAINLDANQGDVIAVLGPNGHGKSTLLKAIINYYNLNKSGQIKIDNKDITNSHPDEIANMGIFYATQNPIEIPGVSQLDLYKSILNNKNKKQLNILEIYQEINKNLKLLNFSEEILKRSVNDGFSGGEKKKNEIVQMLLMDPKIILLDEIDSGLDIDTFKTIANVLKQQTDLKKTIIYITHNKELVNAIKPNKVILIVDGQIAKKGDIKLANEIFSVGFKKYFKNLDLNDKNSNKERVKLASCGVKNAFKNNKINK